jgi:Domain of unknown function (DUF2804), C-terminal
VAASAALDRPYRGSTADRPVGVPFPPEAMPLYRGGTLLKRWHYVSFWSTEVVLCANRVHVGPIAQEYWGVLDRTTRRFVQGTNYVARKVSVSPTRLTIDERDVAVDVPIRPDDEFEVYRPEGRAYTWSRKQFAARATAEVRMGSRTLRPEGAVFVDIQAGYHPRSTSWRWSAGAGFDQDGRRVAWNAIIGLADSPTNSERTLWIDGAGAEIDPVRFDPDGMTVFFSDGARLAFRQEAVLRKHVALLLIRSKYDHGFGMWEGTLPGGLMVRDGVGVREWQDAMW